MLLPPVYIPVRIRICALRLMEQIKSRVVDSDKPAKLVLDHHANFFVQ
jgi:hypothetical protein